MFIFTSTTALRHSALLPVTYKVKTFEIASKKMPPKRKSCSTNFKPLLVKYAAKNRQKRKQCFLVHYDLYMFFSPSDAFLTDATYTPEQFIMQKIMYADEIIFKKHSLR